MSTMRIPYITDNRLAELYEKIKPVRKDSHGKLCWMREYRRTELRSTSFIWDSHDLREPVKQGELIAMPDKDFRCLHQYGYHGLFKPTIAEVIAQINPKIIQSVAAFELIEAPKDIDEIYDDKFAMSAFEAGFHVSKIRLYRNKTLSFL